MKQQKCNKCGKIISYDPGYLRSRPNFCDSCGNKLDEYHWGERVCTSCGQPLFADQHFCPGCGGSAVKK